MKKLNQCDGCIAGHPLQDPKRFPLSHPHHLCDYPSGGMVCQAYKYDCEPFENLPQGYKVTKESKK